MKKRATFSQYLTVFTQRIVSRTIMVLCIFMQLPVAAQQQKMPNIVFVMADDLGYSDLGCYGSDYYETPNIDQLASEGMRFTSAYAYSLCSPTRASFLTGKDPARLHITHAIPIKGYKRLGGGTATPLKDADYVINLPLEEVTIAETLKKAGYVTARIGKYHVCEDSAYYAQYQGFDFNVAADHHGHTSNYFFPYITRWRLAETDPWLEWKTLPDGKPGEYLTDRLTDEAITFVEKNRKTPFFLYLSHYAVHTPIQAKPELVEKFKEKAPDWKKGHVKPDYAAMILSLDESVGRLMRKLEELGIDDNTIVFFMSDNGGHGKHTSNFPFRGNKGNFYEGGIRVPLIVRWPNVVKSGSASDIPVITADLYPTFLEMIGLPLMPEQHIDGKSLLPLLKGGKTPGHDALYWHFPNYTGVDHPDAATPQSVVRYHDWKLIEFFETNTCELYNLKDDITESKNLAASHTILADSLKKMLNTWRIQAKVQMPGVNPGYRK